MARYVYIEDSILEAFEKLPYEAKTREMQKVKTTQKIIQNIQTFNELTSDFQDTWPPEYWKLYEEQRKGPTESKPITGRSYREITRRLADLEDMALTLTRMSRGPKDSSIQEGKALAQVNEEASYFSKPKPKPPSSSRLCQTCNVF